MAHNDGIDGDDGRMGLQDNGTYRVPNRSSRTVDASMPPTSVNVSRGTGAVGAPLRSLVTVALGKAIRASLRLTRHGGSALPGKVVETFDPAFLARTLSSLPYGVVLVSGTNGKTTTTRMVASMLADLGLKVFTNPTGSNFTRGVVSALLTKVDMRGRLDADIAVLELDEAYAVRFVRQVRPRYALLLNVMRDQLDRFGEIDNTARLLGKVAQATDGTVVLNREDRRIRALASLVPQGSRVRYFGLSRELRSQFPSDDEMHAEDMAGVGPFGSLSVSSDATVLPDATREALGAVKADRAEQGADLCRKRQRGADVHADVVLTKSGPHHAGFTMDGTSFESDLRLDGLYNLYNAAAALATVRAVMDDAGMALRASMKQSASAVKRPEDCDADRVQNLDPRIMKALANVTPAFGRGETFDVGGVPVQLLLVKNPMGFRMSLASFPPQGCSTMIAINDDYADGRDMSWLWDVDFASLRRTGVEQVTGVRAWDMALRLEYDQVQVANVETDLPEALRGFLAAEPDKPKHVYCTYTAMLAIRAQLGKYADVPDAGVGR